jgi:hypothetical protein
MEMSGCFGAGQDKGLVCLHLDSGLVLDVEVKLILLKFWRG